MPRPAFYEDFLRDFYEVYKGVVYNRRKKDMTDDLLKNEKLAKEILERLRDFTKEVVWKTNRMNH